MCVHRTGHQRSQKLFALSLLPMLYGHEILTNPAQSIERESHAAFERTAREIERERKRWRLKYSSQNILFLTGLGW